jgi:hypothetical protein
MVPAGRGGDWAMGDLPLICQRVARIQEQTNAYLFINIKLWAKAILIYAPPVYTWFMNRPPSIHAIS